MTACWLAPNVQSDLQRLFREPALWPRARTQTGAFQLYAMQMLEGGAYQPNGYPALVEAGVFARLAEWGIPFSVEIGVVKEGTPGRCDGSDGAKDAHEIIRRTQQAGGQVAHFSIDCALTSGLQSCGQPVEEIALHVADFITQFKTLVPSIGVIESYPLYRVPVIQRYLTALHDLNVAPSFLHLDVDRLAVRGSGMDDATFGWELRHLHNICEGFGIAFGIIVWGQNLLTAADYRKDALAWRARCRTLLGRDPDHWVVQSWEYTRGEKIYPNCVPETDPLSMTAVLLDVVNPPVIKLSWWQKLVTTIRRWF